MRSDPQTVPVMTRLMPLAAAVLAVAATVAGPAHAGGPPNDDCADATPIGDGTVNGTTIGANSDGTGSCGQSSSSPDVWYAYTAPMDGLMTATTCGGADYDTVLGLWSGCPGDGGSQVTCNDDSCGLQSTVTWPVMEGLVYLVRVAGWSGQSGNFTLTVSTEEGGSGSDGPDVIYQRTQQVYQWDPVGGVRAYSLGSHTCNIGNVDLDWGGGVTPLLAMNAYRLHEGRLEQIGMSWVKNGTVAAAGNGCGLPCSGRGGFQLPAGCQDIYTAGYNGGQTILGPRSAVNAYTGAYPGPSGGTGNDVYKRLQIHESDLMQAGAGALYFVEGTYVAWDDAFAGNAHNNASYKQVNVLASFDLSPSDTLSNIQSPAIYAWQAEDPSVQIDVVDVPDEGRFHVASKATDLDGTTWRYDYAIFNLNSHRSADQLFIDLPDGVTAGNIGFHDVDYHSGEPYDNTDWSIATGDGYVRWTSPESYEANPNTNALRWGTMYNFWFEADAAPADGQASISLFRPGTPDSVTTAVLVPGPTGTPCAADVNGDRTVDVQDMVEVVLSWGPCPGCPADVDGDGEVTVSDLVDVILAWGPCGG